MNAIELVPARAWQPRIDQHGEVVQDTFVAELTGLLDLDEAGWPEGTRIIVRQEPLHPRYPLRAHVEDGVKPGKALGPARWPSRSWAINVTRTQVVAITFSLLACSRLLALPEGELRAAEPKLLRFRLLNLPARLTRGQCRRWLHLRADWPPGGRHDRLLAGDHGPASPDLKPPSRPATPGSRPLARKPARQPEPTPARPPETMIKKKIT